MEVFIRHGDHLSSSAECHVPILGSSRRKEEAVYKKRRAVKAILSGVFCYWRRVEGQGRESELVFELDDIAP